MNAIFWGFLLWLLISNHYLRMMIKDAYRYKKTNQQVREFENWYFSGEKKRSILLPYRELAKNCSAPRHMKFFQMMRRINWCVIIVGLFYVIFNDLPWSKQIKFGVNIYSIINFATVYKGNIIKNLIMDCQSYTKYRPNETTGGIFVSWRRKEELPTGA